MIVERVGFGDLCELPDAVGLGRHLPQQLEVRRWMARRLASREPVVAAGHHSLPRPCHRHVAQAVLGLPRGDHEFALVVGEVLAPAHCAQLRHPLGIAPQRGWQHLRLGHPVVRRQRAGEDTFAQRGQEDKVPLEALGAMGGEQFHRIEAARHRLVEAFGGLTFCLEPGQQPTERAITVNVDVASHRLHELAQLPAAAGGVPLRVRFQLQADSAALDHQVHQLQHRLVAVLA